MHQDHDTIAAIATPPGKGGIGIVRVSGPQALAISRAVTGSLPPPKKATHRYFNGADGAPIDEGIVLFFTSPASYTGEDVLELQGHGGPLVLDAVLERVLGLGARLARPGEFTERAFLNGRLDLAQAEAVADLIDSRTQAAARAAMRSLMGSFSREITSLSTEIADFRVLIEANIDFFEEPVEMLSATGASVRLARAQNTLASLLDQARPGALLASGARVVLAGRPNVGKSSLMNALARDDRAIVNAFPGTTRDLVEVSIDIDGIEIQLTDTAGLRASGDAVESEGVRRASAAIDGADLVLAVEDDTLPVAVTDSEAVLPEAPAMLVVFNKCDLSRRPAGPVNDPAGAVSVSAKTGAGIESLELAIKRELGYTGVGESPIMARRRHVDALARAQSHMRVAETHIGGAMELLAEELRLVQLALGEITGEVTTEDLLGQIFSSFCIGK